MHGDMLSQLLTLVVFGSIGSLIAPRLKMPVPIRTWVLLVIAVIVGSFVGVDTWMVSVYGVGLLLNWAIVSFCLGVLLRLMVRTFAQRGSPKHTA